MPPLAVPVSSVFAFYQFNECAWTLPSSFLLVVKYWLLLELDFAAFHKELFTLLPLLLYVPLITQIISKFDN